MEQRRVQDGKLNAQWEETTGSGKKALAISSWSTENMQPVMVAFLQLQHCTRPQRFNAACLTHQMIRGLDEGEGTSMSRHFISSLGFNHLALRERGRPRAGAP